MLSCSSAGLRAIQQHVTLRHRPRACAGLTSLQVNEAVARAIREAVGPLPKAAGRRLALRDSKYLAGLVTTIPPGKPVTAGTGPAERSGETQAGLAGLACWIATAGAGSYLLARMLRAGSRQRAGGRPPAVAAGHVAAAVGCVAMLAAFTATGTAALGWTAVGLVILAAGLGMATLGAALPEPRPDLRLGPAPNPPGAARRQSLVVVIAVHGVLATATILLVVLAATAGH